MNKVSENKGIYSFLFSQLWSVKHVNLGMYYLIFVCLVWFSLINIINLQLSFNYIFTELITYKCFFLLILYVFIPITFFMMGNLFLPSLLNTCDMAFPRLNNLSFWLLAVSYVIALESLLNEMGMFVSEWVFIRLPYITSFFYYSFNKWEDLFIISLSFYCCSLILQAINYLITIMLKKKWAMFFNNEIPIFILTIMCGSLIIIFYVPTLVLILLDLQLSNFTLNIGLNYLNIKNDFFLESTSIWLIYYPLVCIFIIIVWGSLSQFIFNIKINSFCSKTISKIVLINSFLSIIFYYVNLIFPGNIMIQFYMQSSLKILLTLSLSLNVYLWLKELNLINLKKNLLAFFGIGCLFYYSITVLIIVLNILFKISFNFEAIFNNFWFYVAIIILTGSSFAIIGVLFKWLLNCRDYSKSFIKVLMVLNFGFLITGSLFISNNFFENPINNYLISLGWFSVQIGFSIFFIFLLIIFLNIQGPIFLNWIANSYMLFIKSFYEKEEYPQTFINDSLITGAIITRIVIWSYFFEVISFNIRIILICFVPFLFLRLFASLLLFPYLYLSVYFNGSKIGRLLNIFLSKYGDKFLVEDFFIRLAYKKKERKKFNFNKKSK